MTNFALLDHFAHGSKYVGEHKPEDVPRTKSCQSCAFTNCLNTVRPKHVPLKDLLEQGDFFDVFYCHEPDTDGKLKICASWYKHFGETCLSRHFETEAQIEEFLNKDEPCYD